MIIPAQNATAATNTKIGEASRYTLSTTTLQALVVKTSYWSNTYATMTSWERTSATAPWVKKVSGGARLGYNGISYYRKQNSGKTPAGKFKLSRVLTPALKSGVTMKQKVYDSNDYWVYDPRDPTTYNTIQPSHPSTALWRTSEAERLMAYKSQYNPAIVINFNLPYTDANGVRHYADTTKGGGIFLHVNGSGATAGCVSAPYDRIGSISRWLRPSKNPYIIMGEDDWLKGIGTTR